MTVLAIIFLLIGLGQLVRLLAGGGVAGGGSAFSAGTAMRVGRLGGLLAKMLRR